MGVRVFDDDDADFCNSSCYSYDSTATAKSSNTSTPSATAAKITTTTTTPHHYHHESKTETTLGSSNAAGTAAVAAIFSRTTKDLIGNSKEFRIENNKSDLRIIGNDNRIRIAQNAGNLIIIGNNTRLKINKNDGHIKYTGNDGRISLGNESVQQTVDYIGCNGILKIKTVIDMEKKSKTSIKTEKMKSTATPLAVPLKVKTTATTKSASFGGVSVVAANEHDAKWQQFNRRFQCENWQQCMPANTSLPNLKLHCSKPKRTVAVGNNNCKQQHCNVNNSISVVNNVGNICIKNAVNVRI